MTIMLFLSFWKPLSHKFHLKTIFFYPPAFRKKMCMGNFLVITSTIKSMEKEKNTLDFNYCSSNTYFHNSLPEIY